MKDDAAMIYAELATHDDWEERGEKSYEAKDLRAEYRKLIYTPEAVKMIEAFTFTAKPKAKKAGK